MYPQQTLSIHSSIYTMIADAELAVAYTEVFSCTTCCLLYFLSHLTWLKLIPSTLWLQKFSPQVNATTHNFTVNITLIVFTVHISSGSPLIRSLQDSHITTEKAAVSWTTSGLIMLLLVTSTFCIFDLC